MSKQIINPSTQMIPWVAVANQNPPAMDPFLARVSWALSQNPPLVWLEEFSYIATWNTLAASASGQQPNPGITVDPTIDFIATQLNLCAFTAAGTVLANPDYLLQITEATTRGDWFSQPAHVALVTGQSRNSGSSPKWMAAPRYVRGNNALNIALTNLTATAARVDLELGGYRLVYLLTDRRQLFGVPA